MGTTGTNVFLYEITIFHGYQWVPMGTKSQGVMDTTGINAFNFHSEYVCVGGGGGIMGATGTNVFLYEITIFHGYQWVPSLKV